MKLENLKNDFLALAELEKMAEKQVAIYESLTERVWIDREVATERNHTTSRHREDALSSLAALEQEIKTAIDALLGAVRSELEIKE